MQGKIQVGVREGGTMNIKVTFYPGVLLWIAYYNNEYGVGLTHYEAIGRLMCVLGMTHKDFTIKLTTEE